MPGQQKTRVYVPSITVALPVMHISIDTSIDNIFYAKKKPEYHSALGCEIKLNWPEFAVHNFPPAEADSGRFRRAEDRVWGGILVQYGIEKW